MPEAQASRPCVAFLFRADGVLIAKQPCLDSDFWETPLVRADGRFFLASDVWFLEGFMCVDFHEVMPVSFTNRFVSERETDEFVNLRHMPNLPAYAQLFAKVGASHLSLAVHGNAERPFFSPGGKSIYRAEVQR